MRDSKDTDKKRAGQILEGRTWDDMPAVLG